MSRPYNPFEEILKGMLQDSGHEKSDTVQPAPADSVQQKPATGTPSNPWSGVVTVALILGFLFAIAWLVITHVG